MLAGAQAAASLGSWGSMKRSAHQERLVRETGEGRGSIGASWRYDSNSSGITGAACRYRVVSQLATSRLPPPASRILRLANPISHSSAYSGCFSDTPNRESLRAGKV